LESSLAAGRTSHDNITTLPPKQFASESLIESDMAQQQQRNMYSDDDEFYDALSEDDDDDDVIMDAELREVNGSGDGKEMETSTKSQTTSETTSNNNNHNDESSTSSSITSSSDGFRHRDSLPVEMFSRDDFSIWHVLRECIGKELSKITMPVIFNEPLSFIQRIVEYMEYSSLIKQASQSDDSITRLEYVTTFAISALASQFERLGKPFNPLLGETFEYKREDLGFHWMSEQVSHHPPVSAFCALGTDDKHPFEFRGCCDPKIRFWGKTVNIEPRGHVVLDLVGRKESYTWTNPSLSVHNIVVGKMWMEQHGVIEIMNLTTKEKCVVEFKSYSWFTNDLNKIEATCYDAKGAKVRVLVGDWTKCIYSLSMDAMKKYQELLSTQHKSDKHLSKAEKKEVKESTPMQRALSQLESDESCDCRCLWKVRRRPSNSPQMYNMTKFAMSINQPDVDGYQIAPTDSRKRPDIRLLENGDIDAASTEKGRLEEKQRAARKVRTKKKQEWTPRWFEKTKHPQTKSDDWKLYAEKFHKRDWSDCPDIF